jgi:autotransporter-associated beta strand protein/T5SS/PEP-CTERM-associated repeat protein
MIHTFPRPIFRSWFSFGVLVFAATAEAQDPEYYQWKEGEAVWNDTAESWLVPPHFTSPAVLPAGADGVILSAETITVTGNRNVSSLVAQGGTVISGGTLTISSELGSLPNAERNAGHFFLQSPVTAPGNLFVRCYDSSSPIFLDGNTGTVAASLVPQRGYTTLRNGANWSCGQLTMLGTDQQQTLWEVATGSTFSVGAGGVQMGRNTALLLSGTGATFTTTGNFMGTNEGDSTFAVLAGASATVDGTMTVTRGGNQVVRVDNGGILTVGGLVRGSGDASIHLRGTLKFTNPVADYSGLLQLDYGFNGYPVIDTNGHNVTLTGRVSGFNQGIAKEGAGILKLTGNNTNRTAAPSYTHLIRSGFLEFGSESNLGDHSRIGDTNLILLDGGGLRWAAGNTIDMGSRLHLRPTGGWLDTNGNDVPLSSPTIPFQTGFMGGWHSQFSTGKLTKVGAGTLTLLNEALYRSGEMEVAGGFVAFGALNRFGSGPIRLNGGGLRWLAGNTADVSARLQPLGAGGGVFDTNGNNVTFSSWPVSGVGNLVKTGAGTLTIIGTHPFTGGLLAESGTLALNGTFANKASLRVGSNSAVTLNLTGNSSSLSTTGNAIIGENPTGAGTVNVSGTGAGLTVGTTLHIGYQGSGSLTVDAGSSITAGNVSLGLLAGSSGTLVLNQGATLNVGGADGLATGAGSASVQLKGATLKVTGSSLTTTVPLDLTNNNTIDTSGVDGVFAGVLSGTGGVTKIGGGTLHLNAPNAYAAGTALYGGQIVVPSASSLGNGAVSIYGGNLHSTGTFTRDVAVTVAGAASSLTAGGYLEFGLGGTGTLAVTGGAQVSTPSSIAFGVLGGGTLGLAEVSGAGSSLSCGTTMFLGYLSSGSVTVGTGGSVSVGQMLIASGNASQGFFNLNTGGTLNVGGVNGIAKGDGASNFNFGGGLMKVTGSSLTTSVPMTLTNSSVIDTSGVECTLSGVLSGSGNLAKIGAGTLHLTAANSLSGDTTVWAGTLSVATPASLSTRHLALNGGTLDLAFSGTTTVQTLGFDGVIQLGGTWGSLTSSAVNKTSRITGNGILQVLSAVPPVVFNEAANAGLSTTIASGLLNLFTATGVSPAGGTFSGPGVTGDNFDPAAAGYGIHTITYNASTNSANFTITVTGGLTLDEEGGSAAPLNLALGSIAFAKDALNHPSHTIAHLNDGIYGNSNSWIGETTGSFAGIFINPPSDSINRIAFGRDNTGAFTDRCLDFYLIQYTTDPAPNASTMNWTTIGAVDYRNATPGITQPALRHLFSFPAVQATGIRIVTASFGTAIDEIEVYPASDVFLTNGIELVEEGGVIAHGNLSSTGTAFAKDVIGVAPHAIAGINNGSFGNASSWIGGSVDSFVGINLGGSKSLDHIAFGRDNTGEFTDRSLGRYTLQYTTAANPNASTPDASWTTIGIMDYMSSAPGLFANPSERHLFRFPAVTATGVRLLVPAGAAIDELELYLAQPHLKLEQPVDTALTSAASTVDFGSTYPALPITKTFTLRNTGIVSLNLGAITISGTGAGDFSASTPTIITLASQGITTFDVTFTPTVAGSRSATLHIASDDPGTASFEVNLTGSGLVPTFNTATNNGITYQREDAAIDLATVTGATPPGGTFSGPGVTDGMFDPSAANSGFNAISYTAQGATSSFILWISFPPLVLKETGGSFAPGNLAIGKTAFAKDVIGVPLHTIAKVNDGVYGNSSSWIAGSTYSFIGINLGSTPVTVSHVAFGRDNTGNAGDRTSGTYTLEYTTTPNPSAATPDASWHSIRSFDYPGIVTNPKLRHLYAFPPVLATGFRLSIQSVDIAVGIDELELYGYDIVPQITLEEPVATPFATGATATFSSQNLQSSGPAKTFTIRNSGTLPLTLGSVTKVGAQASEFLINTTGMSTTLAAGATTAFTVSFHPTALGERSTTLRVSSDDPNTPDFDMTLTGTGIDTSPPVITPHANVNASSNQITGTAVTYSAATVSDNDSTAPVITYSHPSGSNFPVGETTVTITATDASNNSATSTFTVNVRYVPEMLELGGTFALNNLAIGKTAFAKDLVPVAPHTIASVNDGIYGNPSSWIANTLDSFVGINLGATPVPIHRIAFGRDNTGQQTTRATGTYTLQYTTTPNPDAGTPDNAWQTIATLVYPGDVTSPALRHLFAIPTVNATGIRLKTLGDIFPIGIDELELYGPFTPQENWRNQYFGSTTNTGDAADDADPNKNGIPNLMEYALGGHPVDGSTGQSILPTGSRSGNQMQLHFNRLLDRNDIDLTVQASGDLTIWTDLARSIAGQPFALIESGTGIDESGSGNTRAVTITDPLTDTRRFLRLSVTPTP